ncbi:hypothetical protein DVK02_02860 [Halobellus sp. Atlit-31R]|nr:hypothetical protein DVK02_02860 [Halobellus sp. Atlit-31R]
MESTDGDTAVALLESVRTHELPESLAALVSEYQSFEAARPPFVWQWVHNLAPANTMPFVDAPHREAVATNKTMLVLFVTILDDLLEKYRDYETFDAVACLVRPGGDVGSDVAGARATSDTVDERYVAFATRVWEAIDARLEAGPKFEQYSPRFRFDLRQAVTAIEYSTLAIERPEQATVDDLWRYETHNMGLQSYLDVDLMHASGDLTESIPELRSAVDAAQRMARIGNWVSTWEREVYEGDVSSGVVVAALERGIVSPAELPDPEAPDAEAAARVVERIEARGLEAEFLAEWNDQYRRLNAVCDRLDAVDLTPFVEGTEDVLRYHIASTGLK